MIKVQVNNKIYYYGVSSKPNPEIIYIKVSMRKHHNFEMIFTSDDVLNTKDSIGKVFGSRERALYMGVNTYFVSRRTEIPNATLKYELGQSQFENDYYR